MRRRWILAISAIALGLSWLALDDITTGNEPSLLFESLTVGASLTWFAALAVHTWRARARA